MSRSVDIAETKSARPQRLVAGQLRSDVDYSTILPRERYVSPAILEVQPIESGTQRFTEWYLKELAGR